jgi:trehalose 6-phosphate phosphatase
MAEGAAALASALASWPSLAQRLTGQPLAIFLDYDGTLTPIVSRPELATLPPEVRKLLGRLAARFPVAILSGRARDNVAPLVGLDELIYGGSHGFDISGPPPETGEAPLRHEVGEGIPAQVEGAAERLSAALADIPGILVEPKRFAVAVHFRLTPPEALPRIEREVDATVASFSALRKTEGKKVFELRPRIAWDKGAALRWILNRLPPSSQSRVPIYIGDDTTDEDGFEAAQEAGGVGILVANAPQPTCASFLLHDTREVEVFLTRLAELA